MKIHNRGTQPDFGNQGCKPQLWKSITGVCNFGVQQPMHRTIQVACPSYGNPEPGRATLDSILYIKNAGVTPRFQQGRSTSACQSPGRIHYRTDWQHAKWSFHMLNRKGCITGWWRILTKNSLLTIRNYNSQSSSRCTCQRLPNHTLACKREQEEREREKAEGGRREGEGGRPGQSEETEKNTCICCSGLRRYRSPVSCGPREGRKRKGARGGPQKEEKEEEKEREGEKKRRNADTRKRRITSPVYGNP